MSIMKILSVFSVKAEIKAIENQKKKKMSFFQILKSVYFSSKTSSINIEDRQILIWYIDWA